MITINAIHDVKCIWLSMNVIRLRWMNVIQFIELFWVFSARPVSWAWFKCSLELGFCWPCYALLERCGSQTGEPPQGSSGVRTWRRKGGKLNRVFWISFGLVLVSKHDWLPGGSGLRTGTHSNLGSVCGWFKQPPLARVRLIGLWGRVRLHTCCKWSNQCAKAASAISTHTLLQRSPTWQHGAPGHASWSAKHTTNRLQHHRPAFRVWKSPVKCIDVIIVILIGDFWNIDTWLFYHYY